ncbi:hypothetical protein BVRB_7g173370 [Beta vulgaris subsp. vulgaris]|nr:hypothetical protein BVRB_7g173370 [Beta vulgaris subsp. vulgaris]
MEFIYNGFQDSNFHLDGAATIHSNGLLQLTNYSKQLTAHAFHPIPLNFTSSSSYSFSTSFAFAMYPEIQAISGHGIVFVLSPTMSFPNGVAGKYFGLFNSSLDFLPSDNIFAVELDTIEDIDFYDIDSNHVGININSLISNTSAPAGYFSDTENQNKSVSLISARPMQIWIDYNGTTMLVHVTMAPINIPKPSRPLLSLQVNLSDIVSDTMYAGFASSTGSVASSHYLLGWSFAQGGREAQNLDISNLPRLPRYGNRSRKLSVGSMVLVIVISVVVFIIGVVFYIIRRKKYEEVVEDWEQEYHLQRFSFKDLYNATKGFKDKEFLGAGGFGKVYKGVDKPNLSWNARFKVIRGVASALVYLHEEWEQVIIHRDVKASNILLDVDMNARLGDFGLARLYDHGTNPQTTHVVGTVGYLAPELTRKGKATTSTDVFSFGVFVLEVACGKSPISTFQGSSNGEMYLVDWVNECLKKGVLLEATDPKLGRDYDADEMELVLKLGLLCCHPKPEGRPNMRQVMQFLNGHSILPEMLPFDAKAANTTFSNQNLSSFPISSAGTSAYASYSSDSILKVGR